MAYLDKYWIKYLKKIYHQGTDHTKDDSPIRQYYGYQMTLPAPYIPPFRRTHRAKWFLKEVAKGVMNVEGYPIQDGALYEYVTAWDDLDMINSTDFIYTYPERIFNYPLETNINQYDIIRKRLLNNLGSNRAVAVLYNPQVDGDRVDIPCLNWLQVTIEEEQNLRLHCMFRSNDIYGAWPSNMMLLSYFGFKLVDELNKYNDNDISFHSIDYHCSSAHYYKTDEDSVKKIIGED